MKRYILLIVIVCTVFGSLLFFSGLKNHQKLEGERGEIKLVENEEILTINPYNDEWREADQLFSERQPYSVGFVDPNGYLVSKGFLSTKAHFLKCESIGEYLNNQGCYSQNVEVISASKDGNNSIFTIVPMDYPDKQIVVTWYEMTEEFSFTMLEEENP